MRGRVPPLLLLGILVLASVSATLAKLDEQQQRFPPGERTRGQQPGQEHDYDRRRQPWDREPGREEGGRWGPSEPREREREEWRQPRRDRDWRRPSEEPWKIRPEGREGEQEWGRPAGSRVREESSRNNPFHFPSRRFNTRYGNQNGRIQLLPRFEQRSKRFENLQNYRIVQIEARPNTLVLPKHADADNILVVQQGNATVSVANGNNKQSFNLEEGHALRIPSGFISYILNPHDNQNLRVAKISMPVNTPGQFEDFFPASSRDQPSYLQGFSRNTLEAAFNAEFDEIRRVLLEENDQGEQEEQRQPGQRRRSSRSSENNEGVIVKVSKEHIQQLTKHAKSVPKEASEEGDISTPINLRNDEPVISNNFGRLFEVKPEKKNPQLQDLDMFLTCVEIKEGALMLPHYNSKAIVVVVVNKGTGNLELVSVRKEQQQQQRGRRQPEWEEEEDEEDEGNREVRRYTARLNEGDVFIMPAGHPVAINATSELHLLGFGINAENNQRTFLAGDKDNVIKQIEKQVKDLAFPGSGEQVERLIKNQKESHFVSAHPQPEKEDEEEERQRGKGPLLSILKAFN
ncbi:hypothetical protein PIB30_079701 [Stylosanthes scabra]|uniref:Cupin type-1 domain-containing protein n=1 Tax=Stylosanthes scabra TaxID=79078 RepID=A0ABU6SRD6_9FABA|nr:hypothetical protein [Stylosanthes scabra]